MYNTEPIYVLYYSSTIVCRDQALINYFVLNRIPEVLAQDVNRIANRPDWMTGVPILCDRRVGMRYEGSAAIDILQNIAQQPRQGQWQQQPFPSEPVFQPVGPFAQQQPTQAQMDMVAERRRKMDDLFSIPEEPFDTKKYMDAKRGEGIDARLAEMQALRGQTKTHQKPPNQI
jgi:hypothetical protein